MFGANLFGSTPFGGTTVNTTSSVSNQSHLFGSYGSGLNTSATTYWGLGSIIEPSTTEANVATVLPHALTIDHLRIKLPVAPGAGKSFTFTLVKNGTDDVLTCTVSGTNTTAQDLTHSVSFNRGDTVSLKIVPSGTPATNSSNKFSVRQTATGLTAIVSSTSDNVPSNTAARYTSLMSGYDWSATETDVSMLVPASGVLKNLVVSLSASPGTGKSYAFSVVKNGVNTGLAVTISDAATLATNLIEGVAVSPGDLISIKSLPSGTPATVTTRTVALSFAPTTDGQSFLCFTDNSSPSASGTTYNYALSGAASSFWSSTESTYQNFVQATTIKAFYASLSAAPGTGKSYALTVRDNGADTAATLTLADAATTSSLTGLSVAVSDDHLLGLKSVPSGTPTSANVKTGLLLYIAPAGGGTNVTATPSVLTATAALLSPTITTVRNVTITPSALTLSASLKTATITAQQNVTITPSALTAVLALQAPSILAGGNVSVAADLLTLSASLLAPTVSTSQSVTVSPSALSLSASLLSATVSTQVGVTVAVAKLTAALSLLAPTITAQRQVTVAPAALSATLALHAPSITAGSDVSVSVSKLSTTATLLAPTVVTQGNVTVSPSVVSALFAIAAPTVATERNALIAPAALSTHLSLLIPTVTGTGTLGLPLYTSRGRLF